MAGAQERGPTALVVAALSSAWKPLHADQESWGPWESLFTVPRPRRVSLLLWKVSGLLDQFTPPHPVPPPPLLLGRQAISSPHRSSFLHLGRGHMAPQYSHFWTEKLALFVLPPRSLCGFAWPLQLQLAGLCTVRQCLFWAWQQDCFLAFKHDPAASKSYCRVYFLKSLLSKMVASGKGQFVFSDTASCLITFHFVFLPLHSSCWEP